MYRRLVARTLLHITCVLMLLLLLLPGKMELFSASFYPAVQQVLDNPQLLGFGSVPVPGHGRTIHEVCETIQHLACTASKLRYVCNTLLVRCIVYAQICACNAGLACASSCS
jgi:hypothetical protein